MKTCNKKFQDNEAHNKSLIESKNFRVIPSIGAIVDGWVLMIPKKHYVSFSEMGEELLLEATELGKYLNSLLNQIYQREVISFENGASSKNNLIGCGVDYAHLHFVPISIDLKRTIESEYEDGIIWSNVDSLKDINMYKGSSYYYINYNRREHIAVAPYPKSQVIRKKIADVMGIPDKYDWKNHEFKNNVAKTINKFQSYILIENECIST